MHAPNVCDICQVHYSYFQTTSSLKVTVGGTLKDVSKSVPVLSSRRRHTAPIQTMVYLPSSFQIRITLTDWLLTASRQTRDVNATSGLRLKRNSSSHFRFSIQT
jgi:hypothetical protein